MNNKIEDIEKSKMKRFYVRTGLESVQKVCGYVDEITIPGSLVWYPIGIFKERKIWKAYDLRTGLMITVGDTRRELAATVKTSPKYLGLYKLIDEHAGDDRYFYNRRAAKMDELIERERSKNEPEG